MNHKRFFTIITIAAICIMILSTCKKDKNDKPGTTYEWEPEMVFVEPGTFTMGCADDECIGNELPTHQVTLTKGYYIGKYVVTQAQWKTVMGNNPSCFQGDNLPVEQVSWDDVQTFIAKLNQMTGKNYRLPTEAEWEYAGRGGSQSAHYKYSGSNNINDVAWYGAYSGGNSGESTHPVGIKQPNEFGIYDMSGNVWEYCSDWYGVYSDETQTNPQGPAVGSNRVLRGGCFARSAQHCRVAYRNQGDPSIRPINRSFRVVQSE
jgi:formylglycine-generating enzyme required for sulfatase activity